MKNTKFYFTLLLCAFAFITASAQENPKLNRMSLGYHLSQYQHDFGMGLNVTSPVFAGSMAVRFQANLQWLQHIPKTSLTTQWTPYGNVRLGIASRNWVVPDKLCIYGEGGMIVLMPNDNFDSQIVVPGGYGVFGFEFHHVPFMGQFIELGGVGTGAKADRSVGDPVYSNGLLVSAGLRFYL